MNTASIRNFLSALAAFATVGLAGFALGLALDSHALAFFAIAACAFIGMIAVSDYAPTLAAYDATATRSNVAANRMRKSERIPLAA